jgi:hypothetical protein
MNRVDFRIVSYTFSVVALFTAHALQAQQPATAGDGGESPSAKSEDVPTLLFVQDAMGLEYSEGTLTLKDAKPFVLYFSDRPFRMAGHTTRAEMRKHVEKSFEADPPNAALVILNGKRVDDAVMTLTKPPREEGDDLVFEGVKILQGKPPITAGACSMFIDTVRMRPPVPRLQDERGPFDAPSRTPRQVIEARGESWAAHALDPRGPLGPRGPFDPRPRDPRLR